MTSFQTRNYLICIVIQVLNLMKMAFRDVFALLTKLDLNSFV